MEALLVLGGGQLGFYLFAYLMELLGIEPKTSGPHACKARALPLSYILPPRRPSSEWSFVLLRTRAARTQPLGRQRVRHPSFMFAEYTDSANKPSQNSLSTPSTHDQLWRGHPHQGSLSPLHLSVPHTPHYKAKCRHKFLQKAHCS